VPVSRSKKFLRFSLILVTILGLSMSVSSTHFLNMRDLPEENFFNISISQFLVKQCEDTGSDCSKEEPLVMEGTASGVGILSKDNTTYVLTADHFCHPGEFYFMNAVTDKIESDIWVTNDKGVTYIAEIVYSDVQKDLCLLSTKAYIKNDMRFSLFKPEIGEKVYAVSAPYGIHEKGVSLHFEGIFSGCDEGDMCYYTIPATGGSSGSLVFDSKGRIIGMIQMTTRGFNAISLGVGSDTIRQFLIESNLF